jgi:hypothetical protein
MNLKKRSKPFRNADSARTRLGEAVRHLATSPDKLTERVIDSYHYYLMSLRKFAPNLEIQKGIEAIRDIVRKEHEKVEKNPGAYELLLREKLISSTDVVKRNLHYAKARKLASMITELYFTFESGFVEEYKDELRDLYEGER